MTDSDDMRQWAMRQFPGMLRIYDITAKHTGEAAIGDKSETVEEFFALAVARRVIQMTRSGFSSNAHFMYNNEIDLNWCQQPHSW